LRHNLLRQSVVSARVNDIDPRAHHRNRFTLRLQGTFMGKTVNPTSKAAGDNKAVAS
jgi:hypothetical protein